MKIIKISYVFVTLILLIACQESTPLSNSNNLLPLSLNSNLVTVQVGATQATLITAIIPNALNYDLQVNFSSNYNLVNVTPSCIIPAGSVNCTSQIFLVAGIIPTYALTVTASAQYFKSALAVINPSYLPVIYVNQNNAINVNAGGYSSNNFFVTVLSPVSAPLTVSFTTNSLSGVTAPQSCLIPTGSTYCQINVTTATNSTPSSTILIASANNYASGSAPINVLSMPSITFSLNGLSNNTFNGTLLQMVPLTVQLNGFVSANTTYSVNVTSSLPNYVSVYSSNVTPIIANASSVCTLTATSTNQSPSCIVYIANINPTLALGSSPPAINVIKTSPITSNVTLPTSLNINVQNVPLNVQYASLSGLPTVPLVCNGVGQVFRYTQSYDSNYIQITPPSNSIVQNPSGTFNSVITGNVQNLIDIGWCDLSVSTTCQGGALKSSFNMTNTTNYPILNSLPWYQIILTSIISNIGNPTWSQLITLTIGAGTNPGYVFACGSGYSSTFAYTFIDPTTSADSPKITINQGNNLNVNTGGFTSDSFVVSLSTPTDTNLTVNFQLSGSGASLIPSPPLSCTIPSGTSTCQINVTTLYGSTSTGVATLTATAPNYISGSLIINIQPVPTVTVTPSSNSPYITVSGSAVTFNGDLGQADTLTATVNGFYETSASINVAFTISNSNVVSFSSTGSAPTNSLNNKSCAVNGVTSGAANSCNVAIYNVNPQLSAVTLATTATSTLSGGTWTAAAIPNITFKVQNVPLQFWYTGLYQQTGGTAYTTIATDNSSNKSPNSIGLVLLPYTNGIGATVPSVGSIGYNGVTSVQFNQALYIQYSAVNGTGTCQIVPTTLLYAGTAVALSSTSPGFLGVWNVPGGPNDVASPFPYNLNALSTVTIGSGVTPASTGITVNGGSANPGYVMSFSPLGTNNVNAIQFLLQTGTIASCSAPPPHN